MIAQQRKTDMLVNNMANANTPGYKAEQSSLRAFPKMLLQRFEQQSVPTSKKLNFTTGSLVGSVNTGVYTQELVPNFKQGGLKETDQKTDLALVQINMPANQENGMTGMVFFTVQNGDGQLRYTRNGDFTLDGYGYLTTSSGNYVLDAQGNRIRLSSDQFTVTEDGMIQGANGEQYLLGVGYAANPANLVKEGDSLYRLDGGGTLPNAWNQAGVEFSVRQGFLENSNVDMTQSMTSLLSAYRTFEANQKVLQAYDKSMDKAANEIGKI